MQLFSGLFGGSGGTQQTVQQNSSNQTHYSPEQEQFVRDALQKATDASNQPYQKYDTSKMFAPFTGDQTAAQGAIRSLQGSYQPLFNQSIGALNNVSGPGYNPLTNAQPFLNAAAGSVNPWQAGSGALGASTLGWNTPGAADSYMNPYVSGAINRANDLSARAFSEKVMPTLNSQFVKGQGQLGRRNYQEQVARSTRDLSNEMSGNADKAMSDAYFNSGSLFQQDQNRLLQAGTAAGNLANQNIGALSGLAKDTANITTGAVNTGTGIANAYGQNAANQSNINLANVGALNASGQQQQQQAQLPLTADYNQWMQQQARPFEIANFMKNFVSGLPVPTSSQGSQTTTTSGSSASNPSAAVSILGVANAANSLFSTPGTPANSSGQGGTPGTGGLSNIANMVGNMFSSGSGVFPQSGYGAANTGSAGGFARGGPIRRYAHGGSAFGPFVEPRGVLSRRHASRPEPHRFAVGGVVPVQRGILQSNMPPQMPMGPPGGLPPGIGMPQMGALGGIQMPPMPPQGGALGMMR